MRTGEQIFISLGTNVWPRDKQLQKRPSEYIRSNIIATTSGSFDIVPLKACVEAMGADRVMFAVDFPYEPADEAIEMLRTAPLDQQTIDMIAHGNAERVLRLG